MSFDQLGTAVSDASSSETPVTADPLERLGSTLAAISSDVARREEELNRLVRQIAVERNQLLDAVLNRVFDGFSGIIPFDGILCSFLADQGTSAIAYWCRSSSSGLSIPAGHTAPVADSGLYELRTADQPLVVDDLAEIVDARPQADLLRRLCDDGARSSLTCPLIADGAPLGFLLFTSTRPAAYRDASCRCVSAPRPPGVGGGAEDAQLWTRRHAGAASPRREAPPAARGHDRCVDRRVEQARTRSGARARVAPASPGTGQFRRHHVRRRSL
ncbi:MAG: hypothetical protein QM736_20315 [Vicinamibacterales bacterium]